MVAPVLAGITERLTRRADGTLNSRDLVPAVDTSGGPYVVDVVGAIRHGETISIGHDDFHTFTATPGSVWIGAYRTWAASSATAQEQADIVWSNDAITCTVDLTPWGGTGFDADGLYLFVLDAAYQLIKFVGYDGRAVSTNRMRLGVNASRQIYYGKVFQFTNIAKNAPAFGTGDSKIRSGSATVTANGWLTDAAADTVAQVRWLSDADPAPEHVRGSYVVSWSGGAKAAVSKSPGGGSPSDYVSSGLYFEIDETTRYVYWLFKNDTLDPIADFLSDLTVVRYDEFPGATQADKAAAALADYAAGYAARDYRLFHPAYLSLVKDTLQVKAFRTMDWCGANENVYPDWSQRVPLGVMSWGLNLENHMGAHEGYENRMVPWEIIFALGRAIDPEVLWVNLPISASDEHVASFASLVEDEYGADLAAGKKLVVELANEVWNFPMHSTYCGLRWGRGRDVQKATYEASSLTYTKTSHGMVDGQVIFCFSTTEGMKKSPDVNHPAYGSSPTKVLNTSTGNLVGRGKNRVVINATTHTFELSEMWPLFDDDPETPVACTAPTTTGEMRYFLNGTNTDPLSQLSTSLHQQTIREGLVKRQCDVLKILKDELSATSWAGIVRLVAGKTSSAEFFSKRDLATYYSHPTGYAAIGHLQAFATAPYIRNYGTGPNTDAPGDLYPAWDDAVSYDWAMSVIDATDSRVPSKSDRRVQEARIGIESPGDWNNTRIELWEYEGGFGGDEDDNLGIVNGEDQQEAKKDFLFDTYGRDMLAYTLRGTAAVGLCGYFCWYMDVDDSVFSLRHTISGDSLPSQRFAAFGGEV